MKKLSRIILNNIKAMVTFKRIVSIIFIFVIINIITSSTSEITNLNDVFKNSFYGIKKIIDMPSEFFKFMMYQMFLIYLVLIFFHNEINNRSSITILRIGSINLWAKGMVISIILLVIFYHIIGFLTLSILNIKMLYISIDVIELLNIFLALILINIIWSLITVILCILIKNEATLFCITLAIFCIATTIDIENKGIGKFIVLDKGMLINYYKYNFNFNSTYLFSLLTIGFLYIIFNRLLKKIEF
ncbi:hypothetical protein JCM1393_19620 [Clostridium carnis]